MRTSCRESCRGDHLPLQDESRDGLYPALAASLEGTSVGVKRLDRQVFDDIEAMSYGPLLRVE